MFAYPTVTRFTSTIQETSGASDDEEQPSSCKVMLEYMMNVESKMVVTLSASRSSTRQVRTGAL